MPTGHFRHYIEHYLAPHPSTEVRELFVSTAILNFATAMVMLFEPLYLMAAGFSLTDVVLFYLALYVLYFFALPLGGRICRAKGFEHSILYSSPFLILYYLSLFAIPFHPAFIPFAIVFLVIQKILYWPGYHANVATWGGREERGREVSNISAIAAVSSTLAPSIGGFVVEAIFLLALEALEALQIFHWDEGGYGLVLAFNKHAVMAILHVVKDLRKLLPNGAGR